MKYIKLVFSLSLGLITVVSAAQHRMTNREVFDYQPGDQIHIKTQVTGPYRSFTKRTILTKTEDPDTITYEILDSTYLNSINPDWPSEGERYKYVLTIDHYEMKYFDLDSLVFPPVIPDTFDYTHDFDSIYIANILDTQLLVNSIYSGGAYEGPTDFFRKTYVKGLGVLDYILTEPSGRLREESIVYFKKSGREFGERIGHLSTPIKKSIQQFNVYPNPTNSILHLAGLTDLNGNYTIINSQGIIIRTGKLQPVLNVEDLKSGMYLIQCVAQNQTYIVRFVKVYH